MPIFNHFAITLAVSTIPYGAIALAVTISIQTLVLVFYLGRMAEKVNSLDARMTEKVNTLDARLVRIERLIDRKLEGKDHDL